jgi:hypothetical protein
MAFKISEGVTQFQERLTTFTCSILRIDGEVKKFIMDISQINVGIAT